MDLPTLGEVDSPDWKRVERFETGMRTVSAGGWHGGPIGGTGGRSPAR